MVNFVNSPKPHTLSGTALAAVSVLCISATLALPAGSNKLAAKSALQITPVGESPDVPSPSPEVVDALNNLNQCAGTIQHYRLPPTGYVPPRESLASREGKDLYEKLNCASCHKIGQTGGELGPPLDGIGGHRGEQFLIARLLDPEAQMREFPDIFGGRPNIMPHPGVSTRQAKVIARYLLTLPEPAGGFLITAHQFKEPNQIPSIKRKTKSVEAEKKSAEIGRNLFVSHGCAACHTVSGTLGRFGPRLDGISTRRSEKAIEDILPAAQKTLS